ncbi:potassium channel family protein [Granulicella mallensis]|uniref:Ion transport 2 domain protein n=1 Tax=Granulicella mallensis (strain ATCC BAA-1857 / DSM 23137 / MP5ACTX8) TaxID=682795 RepID=G8NSP9_GRAMM|nr:potassium channel family protein [Granulicella mallensis]AEU35148.1 Ion transport 2 domain protein [Granulicella mallensis MP5ACTX8]
MHPTAIVFGCLFLAGVLLDAFQTIILPRRPVGRFRITQLFFLFTWRPWEYLIEHFMPRRKRDQLYSFYGPLSLLMLFGLWALLLVTAYMLIYFGLHTPFSDPTHPTTPFEYLRSCFYVSGTTLFTLGLGDVQPTTQIARMLLVLESGTGLGFVALVIGYVPVLYTAFSQREISVALLDGRAGSPPAAGELLQRHNFSGGHQALTLLLAEWERWCAEMLETHISYPILCYYRSQHDNQSWLAGLTAVLDTCALLITTIEGPSTRQAQLTFAIGRHTLVDLGHVFRLEKNEQRYREAPPVRLRDEEFARLCEMLTGAGFSLCGDVESHERLSAIRKLYEPHACALSDYLHLPLPFWAPPPPDPLRKHDGWTTVASLRTPAALADRLATHVSVRSTASQLHDNELHPL